MTTPISVQLYSLREQAKEDFFGVLRTVADIGYTGVEFAGLHGKSPAEVAAVVNDLGLKVSSSHTGFPNAENINQIIDTEKTLGNSRVISGVGPKDFETPEAFKATIDRFQTATEMVKEHGLTFGMHNHDWEFKVVDGKLIYDTVLAAVPDLFSELDVYWAQVGGSDPAAVIAKHKDRLPVLHIKDGNIEPRSPMTAVGSGKLDFHSIVKAADPAVTKWLIVELDSCATDMVEAVRESYRYLTGEGLASGNK